MFSRTLLSARASFRSFLLLHLPLLLSRLSFQVAALLSAQPWSLVSGAEFQLGHTFLTFAGPIARTTEFQAGTSLGQSAAILGMLVDPGRWVSRGCGLPADAMRPTHRPR